MVDNTAPVTRGTAIRSFTSRDGQSQIRLIPVIQNAVVVSHYLSVSDGKKEVECNVLIDDLKALLS